MDTNTASQAEVVAFLDANILLHFKPIQDIDWCNVLGASRVRLAIARITVRELDRVKNQDPKPKLQDRARGVLCYLEPRLRKGRTEVRPGVKIFPFNSAPAVDFDAEGLHREWNDDLLVAAALTFSRQNTGSRVVVIANDSGPRLTADRLGLKAMDLPEELKRSPVTDPRDVEIRELRRQLQKAQGAVPHLRLQFEDGKDHTAFRYEPGLMSTPPDIDRELERIKEEYPELQHSGPASTMTTFGAGVAAPPEEYERYNLERERYFEEYAQYLRARWEAENEPYHTVPLQIQLANDGTAPAEEIEVVAFFPDGTVPRKAEERSNLPEEPTPPRRPRTAMELAVADVMDPRLHINPLTNYAISSIPTKPEVRIEKTNSYKVIWPEISSLKHHYIRPLDPLLVSFESDDNIEPFTLPYAISAANLPELMEDQLHVVVERQG